MKTLFKTILILSAITLAGCSKSEDIDRTSPLETVNPTIYNACLKDTEGYWDTNKDGILQQNEANKITWLNIVGDSPTQTCTLEGLDEYLPNLEALKCYIKITSPIELSLKKLTLLDLTTGIISVSLSKCPNLTNISLFGSYVTLSISGCTKLKYLESHSTKMETLDISNNKNIIQLSCVSGTYPHVFKTLYVWKNFNSKSLEYFNIEPEATIIRK